MAVNTTTAPARPLTQPGQPSTEIPTESPSIGLKRDRSTGDAGSEQSKKNGKLSTQERAVMNSDPNKNCNTSVPQETRPQKQK